MANYSLARMKDGTLYEGNRQFKGSGIVKYCPVCGEHRPQLGGTLQMVMGLRSWVCSRHPKVKK